jgi:hypothetical protein
MGEPVVVVGGTLAGMAAAARLAATGHEVILTEQGTVLGGGYAAPTCEPVWTLPAAWRDLFRKTGRTLDREMASRGLTMVTAPPAIHELPGGRSLRLPTDRGDQATVIEAALGTPAATAWRDLLDSLDGTWQALRSVGLESPLVDSSQLARRRHDLLWGKSVARLARDVPASLGSLVAATAWRAGSTPRGAPAFLAARLSVERSFGRWMIVDDQGRVAPGSALTGLLAARVEQLGVDVRFGVGSAEAVSRLSGAATLVAVDPWAAADAGLPRPHGLRPALAPLVTTSRARGHVTGTRQTWQHTPRGPIVTFERQDGPDVERIVVDHTQSRPDPAWGARWSGASSWLRRPPVRGPREGEWRAGTGGRGGDDPWAQLLSGALAAYDIHAVLTGEDIRPGNRAYRPRVRRRRGPGPAGHTRPEGMSMH